MNFQEYNKEYDGHILHYVQSRGYILVKEKDKKVNRQICKIVTTNV